MKSLEQQKHDKSASKSVKLFLPNSDVKRFRIGTYLSFVEKLNALCGYNIDDRSYRWYYLDEEHDWISFKSKEEFEEAIVCHLKPLLKIQGREMGRNPIAKPWWTEGKGKHGNLHPKRNFEENRRVVASGVKIVFEDKGAEKANRHHQIDILQSQLRNLQEENRESNNKFRDRVQELKERIKTLSHQVKTQKQENDAQRRTLFSKLDDQRQRLSQENEQFQKDLSHKTEKLESRILQFREQVKIEEENKKRQKILKKPISEEEKKSLKMIKAMGFGDEENNIIMLRKNKGDIQKALNELLKK